MNNTDNRPLSKLAPVRQMQGAHGAENSLLRDVSLSRQRGAKKSTCTLVHETSSTGVTQQLATGVEFRKRSESFISSDLQALLAKWQGWMRDERRYSPNTLEAYTFDLKMFLEFLKEYMNLETVNVAAVTDVVPQTIRSWLVGLKNNDYQNASYARYLAAVKNFFNYLNRFESIHVPNIGTVSVKSTRKNLPKTLTEPDVMSAIRGAMTVSTRPWVQLRDYAFMMLMYGCGLRISEALALTVGDLDSDHLQVVGKGNKTRSVPIIKAVQLAITEYLAQCPFKPKGNEPVFVGVGGKQMDPSVFQRQIRKIRETLGLSETLTPHTFRHSFASHLLANGADLRSIQELLGHASLSTTQVYTSLDVKKLLDIYHKAHPRS